MGNSVSRKMKKGLVSRRKRTKTSVTTSSTTENHAPVQVVQETSTEETEPPNNDDATKAVLALLKDAEDLLSTFKIDKTPDNIDKLDLAISSYRKACDLTLPGQQDWVTASLGLAQALQEKSTHHSEQQTESHLDEAVKICKQVISSTPEGSSTHYQAASLHSQALRIRSEARVEHGGVNTLTPQVVAEEEVVLSGPSSEDPPIDGTKDKAEVALASARSSYAEFKVNGNSDSLDLAISAYQTALNLTPADHAIWIPTALETAQALEDGQSTKEGSGEEVSQLGEAIKIYEQVLCLTPNNGECDTTVVSRLSHALRLHYKFQGRRKNNALNSEGSIPPDKINTIGTARNSSNKDDNETASAYLSSGREYLSVFKTGQDPDVLDLAIFSYRNAIRLTPPMQTSWIIASLELAKALQVKHGLCDEPWGTHLDEVVEIYERVLASLPSHSRNLNKVASRLSHVLQLRYRKGRGHEDSPKAAENTEDKVELATFYLDSARDSLLTFRAEGYHDPANLQHASSLYRSAVSLMVPTDQSWITASLELGDALEEMGHKLAASPDHDVHHGEAIEIYRQMLHAIPHEDENYGEVLSCLLWAQLTPSQTSGSLDLRTLLSPRFLFRALTDYSTFLKTRDHRALDRSIFWLRKLRHVPLWTSSPLLALALLERYGNSTTLDVRLLKEALQIGDVGSTSNDGQPLESILSSFLRIASTVANDKLDDPDIAIQFLRATLDPMQLTTASSPLTPHPESVTTIRRYLAFHLSNRCSARPERPHPDVLRDYDEAISHQDEALSWLEASNSLERAHVAGELAQLFFSRRQITSDLDSLDREVELYRQAVYGCETHPQVCRTHVIGFLRSLSNKASLTDDLECAKEATLRCEEVATSLRSRPQDSDPSVSRQLVTIEEIKRELELKRASQEQGTSGNAIESARGNLQKGVNLAPGELVGAHEPNATSHPTIEMTGLIDQVMALALHYSSAGGTKGKAVTALNPAEDIARGRNDHRIFSMTRVAPLVRHLLRFHHDHSPRHLDTAIRMVEALLEGSKSASTDDSIALKIGQSLLALLRVRRQHARQKGW